MSEDCVALANERFGKKLAKISEPKYGDFEGFRLVKMGFDVSLVVERLCSVNGTDLETERLRKMGKFAKFEKGNRGKRARERTESGRRERRKFGLFGRE